ncbi:30S ribosomal protein S16 [Patescibacteria group bacterium]|nr:30S ribosomal protein S16 [Patescibacteria group bacterium]
MLAIRLARIGKKQKAYFRLIVSEKTKDTHGDYLEILGNLNPHTNPSTVVLKEDRIIYWLSKGAQPSAVVHNMLVDKGLLKVAKVKAWRAKPKTTSELEAAKTVKEESAKEVKVESVAPPAA